MNKKEFRKKYSTNALNESIENGSYSVIAKDKDFKYRFTNAKQKNIGFITLLKNMYSDVKSGVYKLSTSQLFIIIVGLIYLVSPIDFIPEIILGPLGIIDDSAAIILIVRYIVTEYRRYKKFRKTLDEKSVVIEYV